MEFVDHHRHGLGVTGASDPVSLESVVWSMSMLLSKLRVLLLIVGLESFPRGNPHRRMRRIILISSIGPIGDVAVGSRSVPLVPR